MSFKTEYFPTQEREYQIFPSQTQTGWSRKYLSKYYLHSYCHFKLNFRLYENIKPDDKENTRPVGLQSQVQSKVDNAELIKNILSLTQDKTIRDDLEPEFADFIKEHDPFKQCLLSLL